MSVYSYRIYYSPNREIVIISLPQRKIREKDKTTNYDGFQGLEKFSLEPTSCIL